MKVFPVFEINHSWRGDYHNLIKICSTQQNAIDFIKTVSLKNLDKNLTTYLEDIYSSSNSTFFFVFQELKDLYSENSKQLKKFFKDHSYLCYQLEDSIVYFNSTKHIYVEGPFELSKEQRDKIEPILQNEVFQTRFEHIQQKNLEKQKLSNIRHSKFLELCKYGYLHGFGWGCRSIDYCGEVKPEHKWTEEDHQRVKQLLEESEQYIKSKKDTDECDSDSDIDTYNTNESDDE